MEREAGPKARTALMTVGDALYFKRFLHIFLRWGAALLWAVLPLFSSAASGAWKRGEIAIC